MTPRPGSLRNSLCRFSLGAYSVREKCHEKRANTIDLRRDYAGILPQNESQAKFVQNTGELCCQVFLDSHRAPQPHETFHIFHNISGGLKGGHLKGGTSEMGFRTEIRTRHMDFALRFALNTSILTALSKAKAIPKGKRRLDRESAV